ncbi:hemerythrin domain-containing protein [Aeromicrobium sp. Leaf350]|uniref:hemerythrin domain-containing protein n=1 Tax=Aeromicrobium sp. Leaf350 TaxID=2876565 RepID=UPI001E541F65|nr:hemerythrin domain-containing protein [Aeromicrobium sp. Leaf350]
MGEGDATRLIAWHHEMTRVHARLRAALDVVRDAVEVGRDVPEPERDLLLYCQGFCTALDGHHAGEDRTLFPELRRLRPELSHVLDRLEQDHSMIEHLIGGLRRAIDLGGTPVELERHLDGIGAIMESHFRYEERELLEVLAGLRLQVAVRRAFGPLAG